MGTAFTIDTPLKVAHLGISSVISLADDELIERLRQLYCSKFDLPFTEISRKMYDYRAKRICAYLNLLDELVRKKLDDLKKSVSDTNGALKKYLDLLPDFARIKQEFNQIAHTKSAFQIQQWVQKNLKPGAIDVNIMTKVDKTNYRGGKPLPVEFNDAHAAVRGFAQSTLRSSLVLSAGLNPSLYGYMANFPGFCPDENGEYPKQIVLKVSDYRSALIQGKFLAKKGLWVSEYRIESGLNCGGHAFPSDGYLLGPILEEFKNNKETLRHTIHEIYADALKSKKLRAPDVPGEMRITAQGGVGTAAEHRFLLEYYGLDSVGWGTPFLLVPEATNVDADTLRLLQGATEDDLYLSRISPLGVRFNSIRGNSQDLEKQKSIQKGKPGSACPWKYLALSTEYAKEGLCTASRQYQRIKIDELNAWNPDRDTYEKEYARIVDKTCLCVGLGNAALLVNGLDTPKGTGSGVTVCPGPNLAYFSKIVSLREMTDHIYGRTNIIARKDRPNLFLKEIGLYLDFLKEKIAETATPATEKELKYLMDFQKNLDDGIEYYHNLIAATQVRLDDERDRFSEGLAAMKTELDRLKIRIEEKSPTMLTLA